MQPNLKKSPKYDHIGILHLETGKNDQKIDEIINWKICLVISKWVTFLMQDIINWFSNIPKFELKTPDFAFLSNIMKENYKK